MKVWEKEEEKQEEEEEVMVVKRGAVPCHVMSFFFTSCFSHFSMCLEDKVEQDVRFLLVI